MNGDIALGCNCFLHRQEVEWNNVYQTGCIKSRPFGADDGAPSPEYRSACVSVCVFALACVVRAHLCMNGSCHKTDVDCDLAPGDKKLPWSGL